MTEGEPRVHSKLVVNTITASIEAPGQGPSLLNLASAVTVYRTEIRNERRLLRMSVFITVCFAVDYVLVFLL